MMVSVATAVLRFNVSTPPNFRNGSINCIFTYLQKEIKSRGLWYRPPSTSNEKGPGYYTVAEVKLFYAYHTHKILKENQP
jgi:hypothetical protein